MNQKPTDPRSSRRQFLRLTAAGAGAAFAFPSIVPSSAFGAAERIRLGHIGVRNQGTNNLKAFLGRKDAQVVAVCDVDKEVLAAAKKLAEEKTGGTIAAHHDYRTLLDDPGIGAVVVTTPDHWHALPTIDACEAGKDVYCEKPLTLFIAEGPAMIAAARKNKRVVQTGSQQRSDARFRRACELVRNGKIGKVQKVLVGLPAVNFDGPAVPNTTPPPVLDYDFWLGPAPEKPYNPKHVHYLFRFFWDYSGGQMTNFGAHHLDIAQWGLGRDDSGPTTIEGSATYHPQGWYEVPMQSRITYTYDDGVQVLVEQGTNKYEGGATFVGTDGTIVVTRGKIEADPADILEAELGPDAVRLYKSDNHHQNWLDCIKSREAPICDVAIGHRSATVCHLGNIAARLGRTIRWDPVAEKVVGDSEAAAMTTRPYRAPWELPRA